MEKYKLMPHICLQHELTSAHWDEDTAKWVVNIRRGVDGSEITDTADVLFLGVGALNRWHWPNIDGLHDFGGTLVHSAKWDIPGETIEDWKDKNVAVIGNVGDVTVHCGLRLLTRFFMSRGPQAYS